MKTNNGFTLLELMTVVTIIGVLSAIAVPNFLNASLRAKVARAQAEQELLIWALEMYSIDEEAYPLNSTPGMSTQSDLSRLTTPIPYLSMIPEDIFLAPSLRDRRQFVEEERSGNPNYFYINFLQTNHEQRVSLRPFGREGSANYLVYGMGPGFTTDCDPMEPSSFYFYQPSNGTSSNGMIGAFAP